MLLTKRALALGNICPNKISRYALTGLLVDNGNIVASDGYRLIKHTPVTLPEADYPDIKLKPCDKIRVIVPQETCKSIAKTMPTKSSMPMLNYAQISKEKDGKSAPEGRFFIGHTNLSSAHIEEVREIEGTYPKYDEVIPTGNPIARIMINPELLMSMLPHFIVSHKFKCVELSIYSEMDGGSVKLHTQHPDFGTMTGVCRGMTIENLPEMPKPESEKKND